MANAFLRPLTRRSFNSAGSGVSIQSSCYRSYASRASLADWKFGQPIHETHPHLLKPGFVTPHISSFEYDCRRARLAAKLPYKGIAILASAPVKYRSGVVFHEFHQDSDFFYLTGFNEPESLAIIERTGFFGEHSLHLFVRPRDKKAELWEGPRSGVEGAEGVFNADYAGDIEDVSSALMPLVESAPKIYANFSSGRTLAPGAISQHNAGIPSQVFSSLQETKLEPIRPLMNDLRVNKSLAEIDVMREVGKASGRSFTEAMRRQFDSEKDLAAFLDYDFKMKGCDSSAYIPVVAGGENALSVHYVQNNALLEDGDLVLVDAGGQYGGYVADISRTWPTEGRFSKPQKDLYQAVLNAQRECISLCRADANKSLDELHAIARQRLHYNLKDLGFDLPHTDRCPEMDILFPHHIGHYIGLDLHDTPGYSRENKLATSQCVTIEPGVYVPNSPRWPAHFRGIGIRIEDSVCIKETSPLVLTTEAVKEIADIEALR